MFERENKEFLGVDVKRLLNNPRLIFDPALAEKENNKIKILEKYLPGQMSDDELKKLLKILRERKILRSRKILEK